MTEEKKITIAEENRFHIARTEIAKIGREQYKDVGIAAVIWANETEQKNWSDEYEDFIRYTTYLQKKTSVGENLIAKYFEG